MFEKTCRIGGEAVIGYTPEYNARQIRFDLSKYLDMWPGSTPVMMIVRPGEREAYKADTKLEGETLVWTIGQHDTEIPGTGEMWIVLRREEDGMVGITPSTSITVRRGPPGILTTNRR